MPRIGSVSFLAAGAGWDLRDGAGARACMNLEIGTQLGDYRIVSRIGQGSYGVVFEAEHVITRRIDAVKFLHDAGPGSADDEQRFLQEIQVQARLHHPNIATVHTAFRTPW